MKRPDGSARTTVPQPDDSVPEGWPPDPKVDDILLGEWIEGKSPSSVVLRRYLTELVRFYRADIPSNCTLAERRERLRWIRKHHRKHRHLFETEAEPSLLKARTSFLELVNTIAPPEGGIQ